MKKTNFILRDLMKAALLFAFCLTVQNLSAQSYATSQEGALSNFVNKSNYLDFEATTFVATSNASTILINQAMAFRDGTPANDVEENTNLLKMRYYKYLAGQLSSGNASSVKEALENSTNQLAQLYSGFHDGLIGDSMQTIFDDTVSLLSI